MNTTDKDHIGNDDEVLEALFKHVSSRKSAPREVEQEIREALHSEWTIQTRKRRMRAKVAAWAIAASVVLALFVVTNMFRQPAHDVLRSQLASVEKSTGDVFVQAPGEQTSRRLDAEQLFTGDVLSTTQGARIALTLESGESVRLDHNSRVVLISVTEIELLSGKIYMDTDEARIKGKEFRILTPSGLVSHVGTQYITAIAGDGVTISVREGEVSMGSDENKTIAIQGQELRVSADGQRSITTIQIYGEDWHWTEQVSPGFNMDGHSLKELLDWVGRETGRKIEYGSTESEIAAAQTQLHGSVDLEPLRAMELMLQTSDLTHVLQDGVILVSL